MGGRGGEKGSGFNRGNGEKIKFHLKRQKERKTAERTWVAKHNIQRGDKERNNQMEGRSRRK
jgi:hypothetical protein